MLNPAPATVPAGADSDSKSRALRRNVEREVTEADLVAEVGPHALQVRLGAEAMRGKRRGSRYVDYHRTR